MTIIALYHNGNLSINSLYVVIFVSLTVSVLFVSVHCDIAEALQIIFLADEELSRRHEKK